MDERKLSLIIPVYNERQAAQELADRIRHIQEICDFPLEIIVVDDGSTDGTSETLDAIHIGGVQVLRHEANIGYGAALKTGVRASSHEWICITDCDGTYPDDRIPDLFAKTLEDDLDMLIGARPGEDIPRIRRFPKWCLRKLAEHLSGHPIADLNSGLRIMRRQILKEYIHLLPNKFSFTSTITLAMLSNGHTVDFLPIAYHTRIGSSKISPFRDTIGFFQLICRTVLWFNPLRVFIPLSMALFVLSFVILFGSWWLWGRVMDVTFGVVFMTSIQVMAIGMLADLVDKRMK